MTAITAITAQSTVGVRSVHEVPPETIVDQVRAVVEDIGVDAVKIGMVGAVETIGAVDKALDLVGDVPVVLDPVMVAESGAVLLEKGARAALRERLLPRATVVTPNLPEAEVIGEGGSGREGIGDVEALARAIHALGPSVVVVTGGHREEASDLFFDGTYSVSIPGERHPDGAAHGSGCTHSSALAAQLALGSDSLEAARVARRVAADAVRDGLRSLGSGPGPVDALGIRRGTRPAAARAGRAREL
jgi:hydroxymethylpyrimidine/phosphomethylpyrimidine kinase